MVLQVRVNALLCFGDFVTRLDKHAVMDILQTIQRCTAVDHSPPTLMCTLGVANSILKRVIVSMMDLSFECSTSFKVLLPCLPLYFHSDYKLAPTLSKFVVKSPCSFQFCYWVYTT